MLSRKLQILDEVGLHARPAKEFIAKAKEFASEIRVRNVSTSSEWVNAKSMMSILTLGVESGQAIELQATGEDEQSAISTLASTVESQAV